jgi:hypothetical protein
MPQDDFQDDPTIPGTWTVWRRISPEQVTKDADGSERPSSGAFDDSSDGHPMSVVLAEECKDPNRALAGNEGFRLVALSVKELRDLGMSIARDPIPDGEQAHAVVVGKKTQGTKKAMKKKANWVTIPAETPPGGAVAQARPGDAE